MAQYQFRKMLLDSSASGRPGEKIIPKALVIHWTANTNTGADAVANRNYFNSTEMAVSAHYIVDDHQIVQCLPEEEMAYHVGADQYKPRALRLLSTYPNDCTIGIEMCVNKDGIFSKTYRNTIALASDILRRYGWGAGNLWRHYDITGKMGPRFFVDDDSAKHYGFESAAAGWEKFKKDVSQGGADVGQFIDMEGHWAKEAVERAHELGLVSGKSENKFAPDEKCTRAEAVVMIMRLYDLLKKG